MKALLRDYNGEQFVYVDVKYNNRGFITTDKEHIFETNIIDVAYDNRSKYVICGFCGEMIKNTPKAIEAHGKAMAKKKNCMTCSHLKESFLSADKHKKSYVKDATNPGYYIVKDTYKTVLACSRARYPRYPLIDTPEAEDRCVYLLCKNAGKLPIADTFSLHPHAFDVLPTVDMLVQKRWKHDGCTQRENGDGMYIKYCHPSMKNLVAFVNSKGIVSHFKLKTGNYYNRFMYSNKYDTLFYMGYDKYTTISPYNLSDDRIKSVLTKVKALFDEVN